MSAPLSIVIPVRNEAQSFPELWQALSSSISSEFRAFVVFDFDEDTTVPVVQRIIAAGEKRLRLVKNSIGRGVVGAILTGFNQVHEGPVLVVMGDLSDDLAKIDRMLDLYRQGFHIVAASRYMRGGRIENGPWFKQTLSRLAGVSLHWLRGLPTHDATNAFKLYDSAMLKRIPIESRRGFELSLELTVKAFLAGYRIAEIPAVWRERTAGSSNFKLWRWLPAYLRWYLHAFQPRRALAPSAEAAAAVNVEVSAEQRHQPTGT
jgi:glycosyltransferase involved in cell wall biosynthesis